GLDLEKHHERGRPGGKHGPRRAGGLFRPGHFGGLRPFRFRGLEPAYAGPHRPVRQLSPAADSPCQNRLFAKARPPVPGSPARGPARVGVGILVAGKAADPIASRLVRRFGRARIHPGLPHQLRHRVDRVLDGAHGGITALPGTAAGHLGRSLYPARLFPPGLAIGDFPAAVRLGPVHSPAHRPGPHRPGRPFLDAVHGCCPPTPGQRHVESRGVRLASPGHAAFPGGGRMRSFLRLYLSGMRLAFMTRMADRVDFFASVLVMLGVELLPSVITLLVYKQGLAFPGWSLNEAILVQGVFLIAKGLIFPLFAGMAWSVSEKVREGTFELFLLKPRHPLVMCLVSSFDAEDVGKLAGGLALSAVCLRQLDAPTAGGIALFACLLLFSLVLFSACLIMIA